MATHLDDYLAKLPATKQQAVAQRVAELIAEEAPRANRGKAVSLKRSIPNVASKVSRPNPDDLVGGTECSPHSVERCSMDQSGPN